MKKGMLINVIIRNFHTNKNRALDEERPKLYILRQILRKFYV